MSVQNKEPILIQKIFSLLGLALCCAAGAHAQSIGPSIIDAAGGSATAGGNTYEYAIGQTFAGSTFVSATLVVTPGVLQPLDNVTGIHTPGFAAGDMHVYPNPVTTILYLQPAFSGKGVLVCQLYDAAGKLVLRREQALATGSELQTVDIAALAAGQYVLNVTWQQGGLTRTAGYKVQKLK